MKLNFKLSLKPPFIICAVRKSVCSDCKGYGLMADHKWRYFKCPKCKGSGCPKVTYNKRIYQDGYSKRLKIY